MLTTSAQGFVPWLGISGSYANQAAHLLLTIAAQMVISYIFSSSLRGWLLVKGKSKQRSATKSKCYGLNTLPQGYIQSEGNNFDKYWFCSWLKVGMKEVRASCGALNMPMAHPIKWTILPILLQWAKQWVDNPCPCP